VTAQGFSPNADLPGIYDAEVERHIQAEALRWLTVRERRQWQMRVAGADGLGLFDNPKLGLRVIHSIARQGGQIWLHVSVSRRDRSLPTWEQLRLVKDRFIGQDRTALQVLPPEDKYVNKAEVLHLWCCLDGDVTPDFTAGTGSI
jgi:hypothetical protein